MIRAEPERPGAFDCLAQLGPADVDLGAGTAGRKAAGLLTTEEIEALLKK